MLAAKRVVNVDRELGALQGGIHEDRANQQLRDESAERVAPHADGRMNQLTEIVDFGETMVLASA